MLCRNEEYFAVAIGDQRISVPPRFKTIHKTRIHSSRMRTARGSSRPRGGAPPGEDPPGLGTDR